MRKKLNFDFLKHKEKKIEEFEPSVEKIAVKENIIVEDETININPIVPEVVEIVNEKPIEEVVEEEKKEFHYEFQDEYFLGSPNNDEEIKIDALPEPQEPCVCTEPCTEPCTCDEPCICNEPSESVEENVIAEVPEEVLENIPEEIFEENIDEEIKSENDEVESELKAKTKDLSGADLKRQMRMGGVSNLEAYKLANHMKK